MPKLKTIYEQFNEYTRKQVDEMIKKLTDEDRKLLEMRYGKDLEVHVSTKLDAVQLNKFYGNLLPKMKRMLSNPNYEPKRRGKKKQQEPTTPIPDKTEKNDVQPNPTEQTTTHIETTSVETNLETKDMTKDDYKKLLELLRKPTFGEMISVLSIKEATIIALRLGYIDEKTFSTKAIAEFLEIDEEEVREITKKVLLVYRENINNFLDNIIENATKSDDHQNTSAVKVIKNS